MIKEFPIEKYKFVVAGNKIVAISTYAGKIVRGVAKCDPNDVFNLEEGKKLAAARCDEKVNSRRLRRAQNNVKWYKELIEYYNSQLRKEQEFEREAKEAYNKSWNKLVKIQGEM